MEENKEELEKKSGVSVSKLVVFIIIILAIVFGAWYGFSKRDSLTDTVSDHNLATVVAVVNDEEILRTEFDRLLTQQKSVLGEPQDDEQQRLLQNQVIDILTSQTLILQKAKESGMSVTDDEVNAQLSQIQDRFADEQAFADELLKQGLTEESLAGSIERDLLIQKYIDSEVDLGSVTVSDEEIKAEYDLAATKQDNLPVLGEISGPIKAQLLQQKQQKLVSQLIDKLKDESSIETFLE
jgi:hypothetical protein